MGAKIIDEGSSDNTNEILESCYYRQKNIRILKLSINQGACVARNEGLRIAKGEYITFLDSDDEYLPRKLELQVKLFNISNIKNLGVVSCGREDSRKGIVYSRKRPVFKGNVLKPLLSNKYMGANPPFLMVKKEVIEKEIFFDPNMPAGQDFDFLVRVCEKYKYKYNYDYVDEILVRVNHYLGPCVYTEKSAINAFQYQYEKYVQLLKEDVHVHMNFILKQAELLFVYGRKEEALKVIDRTSASIDKCIWMLYFRLSKNTKSKLSRAA